MPPSPPTTRSGRRGTGNEYTIARDHDGLRHSILFCIRSPASHCSRDNGVERVYAVVDNLNVHSATDVLLFALAHPRWEFVFQPKYAAYLNLIEHIEKKIGMAPVRELRSPLRSAMQR